MNIHKKLLTVAFLSAATVFAGQGMDSHLRGLVDRTQSDLKAAADSEHPKGDQRKRYENAQGHLSTFDRHLTKGHFDKDELNKSIDNIKGILDKNVLQASTRDALLQDITDLRVARDHRSY